MKKRITCCPHCGSAEGFYTLSTYKDIPYNLGFDGKEQNNSEMYDNATVHNGLLAYCQNCGKVICRLSTLKKQWESEEPNGSE